MNQTLIKSKLANESKLYKDLISGMSCSFYLQNIKRTLGNSTPLVTSVKFGSLYSNNDIPSKKKMCFNDWLQHNPKMNTIDIHLHAYFHMVTIQCSLQNTRF